MNQQQFDALVIYRFSHGSLGETVLELINTSANKEAWTAKLVTGTVERDAVGYDDGSYYNLLYGEWIVADYHAEGRKFDAGQLEKFLGQTVFYDKDKIMVDGEIVVDYLQYSFCVVPMEESGLFLGSDYVPTEDSTLFDPDGAYFVSIFMQHG